MHPQLTEFLLMAHTTIQGTGQPVRCTVVYDDWEPRMSLDALKNMTNSWCYLHGTHFYGNFVNLFDKKKCT
jgi:hypothetical protein